MRTKGFEAGLHVEMYTNKVILNKGDIDIAKAKQETPPDPEVKDADYVRAGVAQSKSTYDGPLRDKHIKQFPKTYKAFKEGKESANEKGIGIAELHEVPENILEVYRESGITTLEQVVEIQENSIDSFPMGRDIQAQAKQIIRIMTDDKVDDTSEKVAELTEAFQSFQEETAQAQEAAAAENEALKEQLAAAKAALAEKEGGEGTGKGKEPADDPTTSKETKKPAAKKK